MTVYFIKPIGMPGPIKIGNSRSPDQRIETLAVWCPFPLEILATIAGDHMVERRFHARFFDSHNGHEWFAVTDELLATIAEINAGSFDVESLPAPRCLWKNTGGRKKWTDEERARTKINNALKRAERDSGLVLDWPLTDERALAFIANPCAETGGVTLDQRRRGEAKRHAAHHVKLASASLQRHGLSLADALPDMQVAA